MNYIQRLLDGAAPAASPPGSGAPIPVAASDPGLASPILAADPRLAIFADMVAPAGPSPAIDASALDIGAADLAEPSPPITRTLPARTPAPVVATPKEVPKPHNPPPSPPLRRISPLQRLAESAPLPTPKEPVESAARPAVLPEPDPAASPRPLAVPPEPTTEVQLHSPAPVMAAQTIAPAIPAQAPPGPWPIAAGQFQPHEVASISPKATRSPSFPDVPADVPQPVVSPSQPRPVSVPSPAPELTGPVLAPSSLQGRSPLVHIGVEAQLPAPEISNRPLPAPATRERIVEIEHIREVPARPAASPMPMTAAGQSVIGPLGAGRLGHWRPRQEGL